jgi:hypothetical protein
MKTTAASPKRSFLKRRPSQNGEMALQITSMADVFTILLIFLLKGYATDAATFQPVAGMKVPAATGAASLLESLKVEIAPDAILVDGKAVVSLQAFSARNQEDWKALDEAFSQARSKQDLISSQNADVQKSAKLLLVADSNAPWPLLRETLRVAQSRGYTEPQLAVVRKGE